jgi:hypothetical protein
MSRIYDLFERLPDGSQVLRACTSELDMAKLKLEELASTSENELYAMYIPTRETVARVNVGGVEGK